MKQFLKKMIKKLIPQRMLHIIKTIESLDNKLAKLDVLDTIEDKLAKLDILDTVDNKLNEFENRTIEIHQRLTQRLVNVERHTQLNTNSNYLPILERKKIYFLFHSKAFWPSWKTVLEEFQKDSSIEVTIIFNPVKPQGEYLGGQFIDAEQWLLKNNISYVHSDDIDIFLNPPDVIVMQTPYDEWHREKKYHSKNLLKAGIKMVHIPYGVDFSTPTNSIYPHVQKFYPNMEYTYIIHPYLSDEFAKYCPKGKEQFRSLGYPQWDLLYNTHYNMPQELKEKINGRKIVVWKVHFPHIVTDENDKKIITTFSWDQNLELLEYVKQRKDLFFIFLPHHMFFGIWEREGISIEDINDFENTLLNCENSTIWYDEYAPILTWGDMFIAERSTVTMSMILMDKPVCYMEIYPEKYNRFGQEILSAYEYASTVKDVIEFIKKIENNIDINREVRKKVLQTTLKGVDGQAGKRIKEDIVQLISKKHIKVDINETIS